jgi:hypothetical protein
MTEGMADHHEEATQAEATEMVADAALAVAAQDLIPDQEEQRDLTQEYLMR